MTGRFPSGPGQPDRVAGVAGQEPVIWRGQEDHGGVDRVGGADGGQQGAGLAAVVLVHGVDVDRAMQPCKPPASRSLAVIAVGPLIRGSGAGRPGWCHHTAAVLGSSYRTAARRVTGWQAALVTAPGGVAGKAWPPLAYRWRSSAHRVEGCRCRRGSLRPHSHSTFLVCSRADGTAPASAAWHSRACHGQ
jgi:hypothetical protein